LPISRCCCCCWASLTVNDILPSRLLVSPGTLRCGLRVRPAGHRRVHIYKMMGEKKKKLFLVLSIWNPNPDFVGECDIDFKKYQIIGYKIY
jgi:hypothetical protein